MGTKCSCGAVQTMAETVDVLTYFSRELYLSYDNACNWLGKNSIAGQIQLHTLCMPMWDADCLPDWPEIGMHSSIMYAQSM